MSRITREKLTVQKMIELYCRKNHFQKDLCAECREISDYATTKLDKCPFDNLKPTCQNCTVHCYQKAQKEKIREIMRFSGPKILIHHPYLAIFHLIDNNLRKNRSERLKYTL